MRVLVVDDEPLARDRLRRMLARVEGVDCVGEAGDAEGALQRIGASAPDVVLLDVEMPGMDGLSFAAKPGIPPVIFTTAHPQFAANAFDLDAVDYLVKPIRQERLERALDRVRRRTALGSKVVPRLSVHGVDSVRLVDATRIRALRAADKYTVFTLDGEEMLVRESLDALEARLVDAGFLRVHRAALVRREVIVALQLEDGALVLRLDDGTRVPVSRRHAPSLRRELGLRR